MTDIKPIIEEFLKTGRWKEGWEERIKGYIEDAAFSLNLTDFLKKALGDDYVDEIRSILSLKLFSNKETLLSKPFISPSYLYSLIKNIVADIGRKKQLRVETSVENPIFVAPPQSFHPIEAEELLKEILRITDEKDRMVLCYYVYKELGEEFEVKGMSKEAVYVRWSRLKKKIKEHVKGVSSEVWRAFVDLYRSEVCSKLR